MLKTIVATFVASYILTSAVMAADNAPHVAAKSPIEAGRYLVMVSGCHDCHTPGWLFMPGKIPESEWLTGVPIGWNGPWGTSYARNLRRSVAKYTLTQWIQLIKSRTLLPPMPAENLKDMSDEDFQAIYAYIKSLGLKGDDPPANLPPGVTPPTPYINMMPVGMEMPHGKGPDTHGGH